MSDWQRIIDNCEMAGLEKPEDMFDVSERIDELDNQVRKLKKENQKLKEQQANGANKSTELALPIRDVRQLCELLFEFNEFVANDRRSTTVKQLLDGFIELKQ